MSSMNVRVSPAVIGVALILSGVAIAGWLKLTVNRDPIANLPTQAEVSTDMPEAIAQPDIAVPASPAEPVADSTVPIGAATLRVSNPTQHPVRVVWLAHPKDPRSGNFPAHWDFAPQEGSDRGLQLSLPDGNLTLKPGDVLVAFAQDGSRRYWGPYIVAETEFPRWIPSESEWLLVLQP